MARSVEEVCTMSEWSVAEPRKLTFDESVTRLHVRIVSGTVNVVGTDEGSARLEVSEIDGPPLIVTHRDGVLTVAYEGPALEGLPEVAGPQGLATQCGGVPGGAGRHPCGGGGGQRRGRGLGSRRTRRGQGRIRGHHSGEPRGPRPRRHRLGERGGAGLTGDLRFNSVSGDLTVVEAGSSVRADSVSGSMIVDLDPTGGPTDISLNSVSGEIAIRLPQPADAQVEANTASGMVSSAFETSGSAANGGPSASPDGSVRATAG